MPAVVNGCLKFILIFLNIIIAGKGAVGIILAIIYGWGYWSVYFSEGIQTGISCLGIYGACREKKCALIWFSIFIGIGLGLYLIAVVILGIKYSSMIFYSEIHFGIWIFFGAASLELIMLIIASVLTCQIRARDQMARNQRRLSPMLMEEFSRPPAYNEFPFQESVLV